MLFRSFTFAVIILTASTLFAEAPLGLRGGTEAFRQGEFERAAEAFAEAEKRDLDDLRIAFNHGAALFAAGKTDEAVETLRRSATAKDPIVAAKSLALLGRISVDRARQSLAPAPEETSPEQRQTVLDHLAAAERHYSEALAVRSNDEVRRNLEEIRAWRSRMAEVWENVDRAQKRSEDMAQRLQWLEEWQEKLGDTVRETVKTEDSPKKFQDFYENARDQNRIAQEIGTAKDELQQILAENQEADPNHPVLRELDSLRQQAESAEQTLRNFKGEEASELVRETARRINRLRMNLAPFEAIVQEAEKRQSKLCETNRNQSETPPAVQVRDQSTVADWMPLMVHRAEQGLEQLGGQNSEGEPSNSVAPPPEQTEALRKSMELAVEHGPEIRELAVDAAEKLAENEPAEALPKQDRALELLRKILEPLRQQQQQQNQQQNQNDQQQQQNESQKSEGQENEKEEQQKSEQQQNEQQQNEQRENEQQQNEPKDAPEPNEQEDKQNESEAKEQKAEEDERLERAERMLRQVRRRQQEATEKRERIRTLLLQLEPVEKDW